MSLLETFRSNLRVSFPQRKTTTILSRPVRARSFKPRPYQVTGIEFLRDNPRAILADAPGLGKTFQACEAVDDAKRVVISCPKVLIDQWAEFIEDQYPDEKVVITGYGNIIKRDAALKEFESGFAKYLIVNHDMFRTYYMPDADVFIMDEMHHFRNRDAKRSKGAFLYSKRVPRVIGLTATPIYRDVSDLWHLLHILDPKEWSSYWSFMGRYAIMNDRGWGGRRVLRRINTKELEERTKKWMLGRSYKDVGLYLPERIDKHVVLRMSDADQKRYDRLRYEFKLELPGGGVDRFFNAGAVLHKLRLLTWDVGKIEAIQEIIDETPGDAPIVVFVWYREAAELLSQALKAEKISGELAPTERRATALNTDKRVLVVTMESLSEGIDLSNAACVIFGEETYVPGQAYQAMSRVLRHTEERDPVIVYYVRYKNTVDEVVHRMVRSRISDAHTILKEALE